jgi:hypothetical protein
MVLRKKRNIAVFIVACLALIFLISLPVSADNYTTWISMSSKTTNDLYSIWGSANNDVFSAGSSGTIIHYNGSTWSLMDSGTTVNLSGIWGISGSEVFAVGNSGTILYYDGSSWNSVNSHTTRKLSGVWGTDGNNVFVVGSSGTILHFDGNSWSSMNSGISVDLFGIWGTDSSHIFAVGDAGTIIHYDGSGWNSLNSGITNDLYGIWGSDNTDIFAVGSSGIVVHYDGSDWNQVSSNTTSDLYGIWGFDNTQVFVVGKSGVIAHYNGSEFSPMNRNTVNELHGIGGFSSTDIFAAGWAGTVLRYIPPVINSLSTDHGNRGEILSTTISGKNLTGTSEVRFGTGIAVNNFMVLSSNQVTANITVVAGAEIGKRDVSVTTPGGSFTFLDSFTVQQSQPIITSIRPDVEKQGATLNVTMIGTNLTDSNELSFGSGITVNDFTVLSPNQLSANITIAASAEMGTRDISISTPGESFTFKEGFTVKQALPAIDSISPGQGNRETTFNIIINGKNLTAASEVQLGSGITINNFNILSPNQISANISIAADAETGDRDVSVTTPGGSFSLSSIFKVKQALPVIISISPESGSQGATLDITVNGKNFNGTNEIRFGTGIAVNRFSVINSNQLTANITLLAGTETGIRDVSVSTPGGSYTLSNGFAVKQGLPVITSISPNQGSQGAMLTIIINGSNLYGVNSVSFGNGTTVQSYTSISQTQLSANVVIDENAVTGVRDVSVTTPGGVSNLGKSFNVKEKSTATLFIALLWVIIAIAVGVFIFILNRVRKNRGSKI